MKDALIRHKKLLSKVLELLTYALVAYFIYSKLEGNISRRRDIDLNFGFLYISFVIYTFHNLFNGYNWDYLMRQSGEKTQLSEQMGVYLKSYLMRYVPGNVVGIMGRAVLNKPFGVPMFKSLWGWFYENILYLSIGIFLGGYALLTTQFAPGIVGVLMVIALIVGLIVLFTNNVLEWLFETKVAKKLPEIAQKEVTPLNLNFNSRVGVVVRYTISWLLYSASFIFVMMGVEGVVLPAIIPLISVNALAYSVGYLSFITPSGAGIRESVMIYGLTTLLGYSIEVALAVTIIARIIFILSDIGAFLAYYLYLFIAKVWDSKHLVTT